MIRVLIIEDDDGLRALLKDFFEGEGFETDSARDGLDGLERLVQNHFDLILTDIQMPRLSGLDILPAIKRSQPQALTIVFTAYGSEEVSRKSLERGAAAFMEKPILLSKLKTLVHEMHFDASSKHGAFKSEERR